MGFMHLILIALVATSTTIFGTKYLNENYSTPTTYNLQPTTLPSPTTFSPAKLSTEPATPTPEPTTTMIPDPTIPPTSTPKPTSKPTPTKTPTPKPTITPIRTPTPKPTNTPTAKPALPTPTIIPSVAAGEVGPSPTSILISPTSIVDRPSSNLYDLTTQYSSQYGVDPNVIRYIIQCESGFNPTAISPNGLYAGLFQFSAGTWTTYRNLLGKNSDPELRFNAEESILTGVYAYSLTHGSLWPNCTP